MTLVRVSHMRVNINILIVIDGWTNNVAKFESF